MSMERQQRIPIQLSLFEQVGSVIGPVDFGEAGSRSETSEERQVFTAVEQQRAWTQDLMERVVHPSNLNAAYRRVKANKGSAGIDAMSVDELRTWLKSHKGQLIEQLATGTYLAKQIRGVQIPKPAGGMRQLGIPTVVDRLVQQAILQVLEPILDTAFSSASHGFRPRHSAHTALKQAQEHVASGYGVVVDMDLERFFDRVMQSTTRFLENKLRLRVNAAKSAVAHVQERKFLGYRLLPAGALGIASASLKRVKERIRQITRRNRGVSLETVISELNGY